MPQTVSPSLKVLAAGVVAIWLGALALLWLLLPNLEQRGQFGDLFGSVNALFSGLAFAGLYSALRVQQQQLELQKTELALQREELRLQRDEMVASRGELASQVRVQKAQFEASIAQILASSTLARIDAVKMESEMTQPHNRKSYVERVESYAEGLHELANRVEERAKGAA